MVSLSSGRSGNNAILNTACVKIIAQPILNILLKCASLVSIPQHNTLLKGMHLFFPFFGEMGQYFVLFPESLFYRKSLKDYICLLNIIDFLSYFDLRIFFWKIRERCGPVDNDYSNKLFCFCFF